jgi:hypothetical protein
LGSRVAVTFEGSVDYICAVVVQVWHDWLIHAAIPSNISWLSESVSVHILVSHVEHWVLSGSPLAVSIWHWRVLGQYTSHVPEKEIGVVSQSLCMERVVVHNNGTVALETTT